MKLETLIYRLEEAARVSEDDMELGHIMADAALLEYANNPKITAAYDEVVKNYERRDDGGNLPQPGQDCDSIREAGK